MKGLSFNVTLSKEQMEEIAALTADKVNYTKDKLHNSDQLYKREIERLENRITKLNEIIVGKELNIEMYSKAVQRWKDKAEKQESKTKEIEIDTEEIEEVIKRNAIHLSKTTIQEIAHAVFDFLIDKNIIDEEV